VSDDLPPDPSTRFAELTHRTEAVAMLLVGLPEDDAVAQAAEHGCITRVELRDGKGLPLRADRRSNRIDLTIEDGVVVATRVG
jgi:hypothetical protein